MKEADRFIDSQFACIYHNPSDLYTLIFLSLQVGTLFFVKQIHHFVYLTEKKIIFPAYALPKF